MVKPEITGRVLAEYRERKGFTQDVLSGLAGLQQAGAGPAQSYPGYALQARAGIGGAAP